MKVLKNISIFIIYTFFFNSSLFAVEYLDGPTPAERYNCDSKGDFKKIRGSSLFDVYLRDYDKDGKYEMAHFNKPTDIIELKKIGWIPQNEIKPDIDDFYKLDCYDNEIRIAIFLDPDGDLRSYNKNIKFLFTDSSKIPKFWSFSGKRISWVDCDESDPTRWRWVCGKPTWYNWGPNKDVCIGVNNYPFGYKACPKKPVPGIEFTVFPNPVLERLNFTPIENWNEKVEIKLIDQYARVVRTMHVPNAVKGQTFTINTTDLKPGLYQLTIRSGEMIESKTIAVKL